MCLAVWKEKIAAVHITVLQSAWCIIETCGAEYSTQVRLSIHPMLRLRSSTALCRTIVDVQKYKLLSLPCVAALRYSLDNKSSA